MRSRPPSARPARLLLLAALVAVALLYVRAVESAELLVVGFAASVTAFVVFSKVISPQFLVWLVPLVPLVSTRAGRIGSVLLLAMLVATQIEVVYEHPLRAVGWPIWVLFGRNVLLVALFVVLLSGLYALSTERGVDQCRDRWSKAVRSPGKSGWWWVIGGCIAVRLAFPVAALLAEGSTFPGLPRFDYGRFYGDANGYYAASRELIAASTRIAPQLVGLALLGIAGALSRRASKGWCSLVAGARRSRR